MKKCKTKSQAKKYYPLDHWQDMKCPVCNKAFYKKSGDWVYQKKNKGNKSMRVFCSWTCMRKDELLNNYN